MNSKSDAKTLIDYYNKDERYKGGKDDDKQDVEEMGGY